MKMLLPRNFLVVTLHTELSAASLCHRCFPGPTFERRGPRSPTHLAELLQVELERLHVHVEAQRGHGEEDVLAVDGLPLLLVAALAGLRRDEADELAHALLHALLGVLRYLGGMERTQRDGRRL